MRQFEGKTYLTIGEVAKRIERGTQTIKNWYEYKEKHPDVNLPQVYTHLDAKGTRHFREEDIKQLKEFRDGIKYGMLSDVSREKWGKRGQQAENK